MRNLSPHELRPHEVRPQELRPHEVHPHRVHPLKRHVIRCWLYALAVVALIASTSVAQQRPVSAASPMTCSPNVLYDLAQGEPSCYPVPIDEGGGGGGGGCSYPSPIPQLTESTLYPDRLNGVALATGEFIETVTDIEVKDPLGPVPFARTYRSYLKADGAFGFRWMHNYEERLDFPADPDWDADCGHLVRWWRPGQHFIDFIWDKQDSEYVAIGAPSYKLQRDDQLAWPRYSIREVGGSVRTFGNRGELRTLTELRGRTLTLRYDATDVEYKLDRIDSSGPGWSDLPVLQLSYDGDRISRLEGLDGRTTEYSYSECGDLVAVTYDGVTGGYRLDGTADTVLRSPVTRYEYAHASQDCTALGLKDHLLTAIAVDTFDPITQEESTVTRVRNVYGDTDDWNDGKIIRHCVDQASCAAQDPHYALAWEREPGGPQTEWLHTTELRDLRDPDQPYTALRTYVGSKLLRYERDLQPGGLALRTTYRYDSQGQRIYEQRPDGTCTERGFQEVGGLSLLQFERQRSATSCGAGQPDPSDRVTFYRYESINGLIRTVTGPAAFPSGVIPWGEWEPEQPGYLEHTVFYDYDFNQSEPGGAYPTALNDYLQEWKLVPPRQLGDVNGDPSDDAYWTGASTRIRKQLIDPESGAKSWVSSSTVVNSVGQPLLETGTDGVRTAFAYYHSLEGDWDWRVGSPFSAAGQGPLARTQIRSKDGSLAALETHYAWTPQQLLAAKQDPAGLRMELQRDAGGRVIQEILCNPLTPVASCSTLSPSDRVIRVDRAGFDLQSRQVLRESLDAQQVHVDGSLRRLHRSITRFDAAGRAVQQVVDPDPGAPFALTPPGEEHLHASTRQVYDVKGQLVQSISPEGRHVCEEYGTRGESTRSTVLARIGQELTCADTHSSDVSTQSVYDAVGRLVESRAATGVSTYTYYDEQSRAIAVADGAVPGLLYSGSTAGMPQATSWERTYFDALGRAGRVEVHGTHGDGTSGLLAVRWNEFGVSGRFWRSSVLRFDSTLDPALVATLTPPAELPAGSQLIQTVTRYDGLEVVETVDGAGRTTRYQSDALGRAHRIETDVDAMGKRDRSQTIFAPNGLIVAETATVHDPLGNPQSRTVTTELDSWGRAKVIRRGEGAEFSAQSFEYDAFGRPTQQVQHWNPDLSPHPSDRVIRQRFDMLGRRVQSTQRRGDGSEWKIEARYDLDGNLLEYVDAAGRPNSWEYTATDANGVAIGGLGTITRRLYPEADGARQQVAFTYDAAGLPLEARLQASSDPAAPYKSIAYAHDNRGRLIESLVTFGNLPNGFTTPGLARRTFAYDSVDRPIYSSDQTDRGNVVLSWDYNSQGHVRASRIGIDVDGVEQTYQVSRAYDASGLQTALSYPVHLAGQTPTVPYELQYGYDSRGRLLSIQGPSAPEDPPGSGPRSSAMLAMHQYVGDTLWSRTLGNGVQLRTFESVDGTPQSRIDSIGRNRGFVIDSPAGVIGDFALDYTPLGDVSRTLFGHQPLLGGAVMAETTSTDSLGRLTDWSRGASGATGFNSPTLQLSYELDDQNNRQSEQRTQQGTNSSTVTYGVNALDQYVAISEEGVSLPGSDFDWIGQKRFDAQRNLVLHWDGWGRLASVDNLAGQQIAAYRYDAQNRRVEKRVSGSYATGGETHLHFLYNGSSLIEERAIDVGPDSIQSRVLARYGYAEDGQLVWMDRDVARDSFGVPNPWSGTTDGVIEARYYVHQDSRGNSFALTSNSTSAGGALAVEHTTYEPYGHTTTWSGPWNPAAGSYSGQGERLSLHGLPILFGGMYLDAETNLYYAQNRYYDPREGRFISRDPIGLAGGANLYAYADAAPHQNIDPEGLRARPPWLKATARAERAWAKASGNPDPFTYLVNQHDIRIGGTDQEESGLGLSGESAPSPEDGFLDLALAAMEGMCEECPTGSSEIRTLSYFSPGNFDATCKCELTTTSGIQDFSIREAPEVSLTGDLVDPVTASPQEPDVNKALEVFKTAVSIGSLLPVVGTGFSVVEAGIHLIEGNPTQAAYAAMGLIPGLKIASRLARPLGRAATLIGRRLIKGDAGTTRSIGSSVREMWTHIARPRVRELRAPVDRTGGRRAHILSSHRYGANKPNKTEFPPHWTDDRIAHNASDVAFDPKARSYMGKYNSPIREGSRDGVRIRVVFFPADHPRAGSIATAIPIY